MNERTTGRTSRKGNEARVCKLRRFGVTAYNKPARTPRHKTKSHVVVARDPKTGRTRVIRFGQQGVRGSPYQKGESRADKARRLAFRRRHAANIKKGVMSAAYWANKEKW